MVVILGAIDTKNVYPPKIALIKYRTRKLKISTRVEFYLEENLPLKYEKYWSGGQQRGHSTLEWCGMSGISFSYVFNNLPIQSYLYSYIAKTFETYFKTKKEHMTDYFDSFPS